MRSLLVCCLFVAVAFAAEEPEKENEELLRYFGRYNAGRYSAQADNSGRYIPDKSGAYNGGFGDRGVAGGFYVPEQQNIVIYQTTAAPRIAASTTAAPVTAAPTTPQPFYAAPSTVSPIVVISSTPVYSYQPQPTLVPVRYLNDNKYNYAILKYESEANPIGTDYRYDYLTENKIRAEEAGALAYLNNEQSANRVKGYYEYEGTDGLTYRVDYIADENGFQPVGAHIPQVHAAALK